MDPTTYLQFLDALPPERRDVIDRVWQHIRQHVAPGYSEQADGKFLTFKTGDKWYVALTNQKNYISLYLMPMYAHPELKLLFDESGKKPKVGKSCINFLKADELPLAVIGQIVGTYPANTYPETIGQIRQDHKAGRGA